MGLCLCRKLQLVHCDQVRRRRLPAIEASRLRLSEVCCLAVPCGDVDLAVRYGHHLPERNDRRLDLAISTRAVAVSTALKQDVKTWEACTNLFNVITMRSLRSFPQYRANCAAP